MCRHPAKMMYPVVDQCPGKLQCDSALKHLTGFAHTHPWKHAHSGLIILQAPYPTNGMTMLQRTEFVAILEVVVIDFTVPAALTIRTAATSEP